MLFLSTIFLCTVLQIAANDYTGYRLVRFKVNEKVAKWLDEMESVGYEFSEKTNTYRMLIDVWSKPSWLKRNTDVLVSPEFYLTLLDQLSVRGISKVKVLRRNIENEIRRERRDLARNQRYKRDITKAKDFNEGNYHTYNEMVDFMMKLSEEHPDLVSLLNISKTFEGRTIYGLKISRSASFKPAIFIDAGIHAREWIAPAAAVYMIKKLVTSYGIDEKITRSIDKFDWYIIPEANPDGYEYSRTQDRLWRKTRSRNITVNKWCVGADANRNWGYRWGEAGANRSPCSNIYAGSHPFSEPEIIGLRDFVTWQIPNLMIYASLHSYGQLLLSPWGFTNTKPDNYLDQRNAARAAVTAMKNATGANYNYGTISELMCNVSNSTFKCLNTLQLNSTMFLLQIKILIMLQTADPASGTSIDYMQNRGVPYIYGIELRPLDSHDSYAFSLPPKYIKPTGEEMLAGLITIGEYAVIHKKL